MKFDYSKLKTSISIFETKTTTNNGIPIKPQPVKFYDCWAYVESVSLRDYQTAVQNNTLNEIKIFIRDYAGINNKMQVEVNGQMHKIKAVMPNYRNSNFTIIIAEAVSD